ncbi:DUF4114 domain-containing protein [Thalassobius sp. Cn5-15]|nr:DUF4114 domain-containing protein [Thalassobius sp. Cn5-15]
MAASSADRDYAHLTFGALGASTDTLFIENMYPLEWDSTSLSADINDVAPDIMDADFLVLQFGDNAAFPDNADELSALYDAISSNVTSSTEVFVTSTYWRTQETDALIYQKSSALGAEFIFLGDIFLTQKAKDFPVFDHPGVNIHPKDHQMAEISKRIVDRHEAARDIDLLEGIEFSGTKGVLDQGYLTSTGVSGFKISFEGAESSATNALSIYEVTVDGEIINARILASDSKAAEGTSIEVTDMTAANKIGFFIVKGGASIEDEFVFTRNGTSSVRGAVYDGEIYHSFASRLNADGIEHVVTAHTEKGFMMGFEDTRGGGDRDFQDAVIYIEDFALF